MINKKSIILVLTALTLFIPANAQKKISTADFKPACDTLASAIKKRSAIRWVLRLEKVMQRDTLLDFYFTESLGDYPWCRQDAEWFKDTLKKVLPPKHKKLHIGEIYSKGTHLDSLVTPDLGFNGKPVKISHIVNKPTGKYIVRRSERMDCSEGLDGRQLAERILKLLK